MTREEAIRILDEVIPPPEHHTVDLDHLRIAQAWQCIKEALTAEPVKHGTWWHYEGTLTCSVCHTEIYDDIMDLLGDDVPRYCPDCGAKMDKEKEDEKE